MNIILYEWNVYYKENEDTQYSGRYNLSLHISFRVALAIANMTFNLMFNTHRGFRNVISDGVSLEL